jgi:hypothetical protein
VERINPFGGGDASSPTAPQDGRVSILTFEQQLAPDPNLRGRIIAPPAAIAFVDWAQPGGVATNAPGHVLADATLDVAFRQSLGQGSSRDEKLAAPPIVMGGVLYFLDASHELRAFNAANGDALWSRELRPERGRDRRALGGGVAGADGRVYAVTGFGDAIAFDAATGQEIWRTRADAPFHAAPTVSDGRVYAVTNDSELVAFDAADGAGRACVAFALGGAGGPGGGGAATGGSGGARGVGGANSSFFGFTLGGAPGASGGGGSGGSFFGLWGSGPAPGNPGGTGQSGNSGQQGSAGSAGTAGAGAFGNAGSGGSGGAGGGGCATGDPGGPAHDRFGAFPV